MSRIGRSLLVHGEILEVDDLAARIDAVTLEDVARVAADVLTRPRVTAAVGPVTAAKLSLS
jgi:predicted Zn-dependent peptidase